MITQKQIFMFFFLAFVLLNLTCTEKIPEGPEKSEILKVKLFAQNGRLNYAQENHWDNRYRFPPKSMSQDDFEYASQWKIPFGISVNNDFDEAIDGKKWIDVKINLWSANELDDWQAQLVFADTSASRNLLIPPGDSIALYTGNKLTWEQKNMDSLSIHRIDSYTPIWVTCAFWDSIVPGTKPEEVITMRDCDTLQLTPVDTVIAFDLPITVYAQAEVQLFKHYHVVKSDTLKLMLHYYFPTYGFRPKFWCREGLVMMGDPPCNTQPPP
ncbi:hypothetical protein H8E88_04455 [candidate division KSB1 bacterium]|nr:hypothetical protein [candidate division KSB1 bacterium]